MSIRVMLTSAAIWACALAYAGAQTQAQTSTEGQTVWSGIYTEAQAYRGEKVADTSCIGCHGPSLDGGDSGPKLVGRPFLENWSSQSVGRLFDWIQQEMPPDAPRTLSREEAAAVLAYILQLNKMPSGKQDLPTDRAALDRIGIVTEKP